MEIEEDHDDVALAETVTPERSQVTTETTSEEIGPAVTELPLVAETSYDLVRELGRGGMGRVLVATDLRLRRELALKISLSLDETARLRFAREALLTARLQHPSIVPVHEAGTWAKSGQPFYAMKLVDGRSLDALIAKTTSLDERLAFLPNVIAVVDALAFAHAQRIIHRDLKPSNVIVGDYGETIVIDWGLAKELADEHDLPGPSRPADPHATTEGSAMGTPPYMSPEQVAGKRVDERADVYGLGAMLYHVLCGAPPYRGVDGASVMAQVLEGPPRPLGERVRGIPRDLLAIVDKAMARDQQDRYPTAGPLGEDLKRFFRGQLVAAHAYSTWELVRRWLRRHRALVSVVGLAAVVLAAGAVIGVNRVVRERNAATAASHRLVVETGRSELELGHAERAARSLAKAYAAGDRDPATRLMLAAALRPLDAAVARYDAGSQVFALAYTPDGTLVTAGAQVKLWDTARGTARVLDIGASEASDLATFGTRVAVGLDDGTARIFDATTGALLAKLAGAHTFSVRVRFSPDGTRLVTTGFDGHFALWNAIDGALIAKPDVGAAAVSLVRDGQLVTLREDNTLQRKAVADPALADLANAASVRVAFRPDGTLVAASVRGQVTVWSKDAVLLGMLAIPEGKRVTTLAASEECIAVGGNGYAVVYSGYVSPDGFVRFTRPTIPHLLLAVDAARDVEAIALARGLVAVADETAVRAFEVRTGQPLTAWESDGAVRQLVFVDDARLVSVGAGRFARISDARGGPIWQLEGARRVAAVAGRRLATAGFGNDVRIWNLDVEPVRGIARTGAVASFAADGRFALVDGGQVSLGGRRFGEHVLAATFAPDGHTLVTLHGENAPPRLWRDDGTPLRELAPPEKVLTTATFLAGGARVIATSPPLVRDARAVRIWDVATGAAIATAVEHPSHFAPRTSAGGGRFVTFGEVVVVWDAVANTELARFAKAADHAALSPDGARVAIALDDGTTEVYDVATEQLVETLAGHAAAITDLDHGARIVTASSDGTARIWTGAHSIVLAGHRGQVTCARLSPDGILVATGGDDGTLRIWDARDGRQLVAFDNAEKVIAVGFSPASDAVFATTQTARSMDGGGRTAVWALPRETRAPAEIQRVLDATAR